MMANDSRLMAKPEEYVAKLMESIMVIKVIFGKNFKPASRP